MRFMILFNAGKDRGAGVTPEETLIATILKYHAERAKAGALFDASGPRPSARGGRIRHSVEKRKVIDGPFTETKEFIG